MLNRIVIRAEKRPVYGVDVVVLEEILRDPSSVRAGIVLLPNCDFMATKTWDYLGERAFGPYTTAL